MGQQQLASIELLEECFKQWEDKMWTGNDLLLQSWLLYWPWVYNIAELTVMQVVNLMRYMRDHDAEQIVARIMDLAPRQVPA